MMKVQALTVAILCTFVPNAVANGVTSTPSNPWVADGTVHDVVVDGTTVYLAGSFTRIGPRTGPLARLQRDTAQPDVSLPQVTGGDIYAIAADGSGGSIIAGSFTHIGGVPRRAIARLTSQGLLDPLFAPSDVTSAYRVAVSGGRVFVEVDGLSVRALDLATGARLPWSPALPADDAIGIYAGPGGSLLAFMHDSVSGFYRLHRLDGLTGAVMWASSVNPGPVAPLAVADTVAYAPGGSGLLRVDLATGVATPFATIESTCSIRPLTPCLPYGLAILDGRLFVSGSFRAVQGTARNGVAALDLHTGAVLPWAPAVSDVRRVTADDTRLLLLHGDAFRPTLSAVDPDTGAPTGWETSFNNRVEDVSANGSHVIAVGSFNGAGGVARAGLAAVSWPTGAPLDWNPAVGANVYAIARVGNRLYATVSVPDSFITQDLIEIDIPSATRTGWTARFSGQITALRARGTRIFAAAALYSALAPHAYVASLDVSGSTPILESWTPDLPTGSGYSYTLTPTPAAVFVGGAFGSGSQVELVAVNPTSGARLPWQPQFTWRYGSPASNAVFVDVAGDRFFVSGTFLTVNGEPRPGVAAFDFAGRLLPFRPPEPPPNLSVPDYAAVAFEDRLYVGAGYSLRLSTGSRTAWNPGLTGAGLGGQFQAAPGLGVILRSLTTGGFAFFPRIDAPAAVGLLTGLVTGNRLDLSWPAVAGATGYLIEAGSAVGASDLAIVETASPDTTFSATAPDGHYYVRVRATHDGGDGPPSNELSVQLGAGACASPPAAPTGLTFSRDGRTVTLQWTAPGGAAPIARYVVRAGSRTGTSDLAQIDVGTATTLGGTVPPGSYFVRVAAENGCGVSGASNEVTIVVP